MNLSVVYIHLAIEKDIIYLAELDLTNSLFLSLALV